MIKDELLQAFAEAYEQVMATTRSASLRGGQGDTWGPREIIAHLAG